MFVDDLAYQKSLIYGILKRDGSCYERLPFVAFRSKSYEYVQTTMITGP
jgi:hypothetical protein